MVYERKNPMNYSDCPIRIPIDILAGSWKTWIIIEIDNGILRPSDLKRRIGIASKRFLSKQLKELEESGIVYKTIYPVIPLKVEYCLTEAGKALIPILSELEKWGLEYKERVLQNNKK